jgi:hypothetical protein
MSQPRKNCSKCQIQDRILYRCKYANSGWTLLCQQCLMDIRKENQDSFEFDETWKTF